MDCRKFHMPELQIMKRSPTLRVVTLGALIVIASTAYARDIGFDDMSFFVTSIGLGKGGDLGGLKGADAHCQKLAENAGAGNREWRAYLSTEIEGGRGESARLRIGTGPWYNAAGILIGANPTDLHLYNRTITQYTALDENGKQIGARDETPPRHDILTGSQEDGMSFWPDDEDQTCNNWTSSDKGSAMVGHHDRYGFGNLSWNSSHQSISCSQADLIRSSGDGLFYCFAAD